MTSRNGRGSSCGGVPGGSAHFSPGGRGGGRACCGNGSGGGAGGSGAGTHTGCQTEGRRISGGPVYGRSSGGPAQVIRPRPAPRPTGPASSPGRATRST